MSNNKVCFKELKQTIFVGIKVLNKPYLSDFNFKQFCYNSFQYEAKNAKAFQKKRRFNTWPTLCVEDNNLASRIIRICLK